MEASEAAKIIRQRVISVEPDGEMYEALKLALASLDSDAEVKAKEDGVVFNYSVTRLQVKQLAAMQNELAEVELTDEHYQAAAEVLEEMFDHAEMENAVERALLAVEEDKGNVPPDTSEDPPHEEDEDEDEDEEDEDEDEDEEPVEAAADAAD